ncbi:MAG: CoA transferase [Dehalococcoidia bacterium]
MTFPLNGVRVLDFGDEPVVLASRLLADLGADVVRVETPTPDWIRARGPFVHGEQGLERSLAHLLYNAGKRSVALDPAASSARDAIRKLIPAATVVIAPLEPSEDLRRLISPAAFENLAPKTGLVQPVFRRGSDDRATDLIGIASGGQLYLNGDMEDPPNHPAGNLAYKQLSLASALAAMSLVMESFAGRAPGRIEVSMQEAVMTTTIQSANENYWHWNKTIPVRRGIENLGGRTVFPAADGKFVSFYQHPPSWGAFADWCAELLDDERFKGLEWDDGLFRLRNNAQIAEATRQICLLMDRDALVREAQSRQILVVPVQDVANIANDPHLRARGFFQMVREPALNEELEVYRSPFISSAYAPAAKAAPMLGEHTTEVLAEWCGIELSASAAAARP